MVKFPSVEWADQYVHKLNSNQGYKESGKTWEGDITFVIERDADLTENNYLYLDLFHGECRKHKFSKNVGDIPDAEFKYIGTYSNWVKLIRKEIDPIQGLLTGKFKLEGAMMKIMAYTKAAKDMVSTASDVETEF